MFLSQSTHAMLISAVRCPEMIRVMRVGKDEVPYVRCVFVVTHLAMHIKPFILSYHMDLHPFYINSFMFDDITLLTQTARTNVHGLWKPAAPHQPAPGPPPSLLLVWAAHVLVRPCALIFKIS